MVVMGLGVGCQSRGGWVKEPYIGVNSGEEMKEDSGDVSVGP